MPCWADQAIDFSAIDSDIDHGRFNQARESLQHLQKSNAENGDVFYRLGVVFDGLHNYKAAQISYDAAAKHFAVHSKEPSLNSTLPRVKKKAARDSLVKQTQAGHAAAIDFHKIDAEYEAGHFEEALWALQDLQAIYPHQGEVEYRVGLVQQKMLDFNAARAAYDSAVMNMDDPTLAYSHLGGLLYAMKQYPQAIESFQHVESLKPGLAYTSYMLAMTYTAMGDFKASNKAFDQTAKRDDTYKQKCLYGQGINAVRLMQYEKGQGLLKQSVAIDPKSDVGIVAKKSLADTVKLANKSYVTIFGLYGFQYDSNVILKPSLSPTLPVITGASDFEHTFLMSLNYAPPPTLQGLGYKVSARAYENLHQRLNIFDITDLGMTFTPYASLNNKNLLFMDMSYDYILLHYKRYMDTLSLKPTLTYTHDKNFQMMMSISGSKQNYFQPIVSTSSNQDSLTLVEDLQLFGYSEDHQYSAQWGGHYTINRAKGSDWSYNAYGSNAGFDVTVPYVKKLTAGIHGSIAYHRYLNLMSGQTQKRHDRIYQSSLSSSYQFTYANVSLMLNYTHEISNIDVYNYVRVLTGINVSGSF